MNQIRQGDVLFIRRSGGVPSEFVEQPRVGEIVVAHSETGHHHVIREDHVRHYERATRDPFVCYLAVADDRTAAVVHLREWDTHAPVCLDAGVWEVRRQRERAPEGLRRVAD